MDVSGPLPGMSTLSDVPFERLINYNAFYRAFVISIEDPLNLGRVKIRVPTVHGTLPTQKDFVMDEYLPWAIPGIFSMAGYGTGQMIVPLVGSTVFVTFEYDEPTHPIYFGGLYSKKPVGDKFVQGPRYLYSGDAVKVEKDDLSYYRATEYVLFKSLKGVEIKVNDSDGFESVEVSDALGQKIIMRNIGMSLRRFDAIDPNVVGELEIVSGKRKIIMDKDGDVGRVEIASDKLTHNGRDIGLSAYPVDSIYMTVGVEPKEVFGGEWSLLSDNFGGLSISAWKRIG